MLASHMRIARLTHRRIAAAAILLTGGFAASNSWTNPPRVVAASAGNPKKGERLDWPVYGGDAKGDHYSPLSQINRANVQRLKVAWIFDTGEPGGLQTNPLVVGRILYGFTPTQKVI